MYAASNFSVNLIGGGLVALGVALLVATLAFWRSAIEDPEVLAPLEVMADRRFARADHERRAVLLNSVRTPTDDSGETIREVQRESHREKVRRVRREMAQDARAESPVADFVPERVESRGDPGHVYEPDMVDGHGIVQEPEPVHEPEPTRRETVIDPLLNFPHTRPQD